MAAKRTALLTRYVQYSAINVQKSFFKDYKFSLQTMLSRAFHSGPFAALQKSDIDCLISFTIVCFALFCLLFVIVSFSFVLFLFLISFFFLDGTIYNI